MRFNNVTFNPDRNATMKGRQCTAPTVYNGEASDEATATKLLQHIVKQAEGMGYINHEEGYTTEDPLVYSVGLFWSQNYNSSKDIIYAVLLIPETSAYFSVGDVNVYDLISSSAQTDHPVVQAIVKDLTYLIDRD